MRTETVYHWGEITIEGKPEGDDKVSSKGQSKRDCSEGEIWHNEDKTIVYAGVYSPKPHVEGMTATFGFRQSPENAGTNSRAVRILNRYFEQGDPSTTGFASTRELRDAIFKVVMLVWEQVKHDSFIIFYDTVIWVDHFEEEGKTTWAMCAHPDPQQLIFDVSKQRVW